MGCFIMRKGIPNKRYTGAFKQMVVESMMRDKLSYKETARQFEIPCDKRVADWERIYLAEGPEGLCIERRGRGSKGRPSTFPQGSGRGSAERSSAAESGKCLPKKIAGLGSGGRATPAQKAKVIQELRQEHGVSVLLEIAQLPRATFLLPSEATEQAGQVCP